jgi:HAD superfamily hydrolase (TIGR01509 family)
MKRNKLALLDLGGVVFQSTGVSNEKVKWNIISKLNEKYGHGLNIGKDLFPEFMAEYNELTAQDLRGEAFLESVFDTLEINRELIEMLGEEREIVIVSDNYRENIAYISRRYAFDSWAFKQVYSFDYQMVKENPLFFEKLLAELDAYDKESMIFIDDSIEKIASAAKHGIRGIRFENNEQIRRELNRNRS